jgi:hypothetical protein
MSKAMTTTTRAPRGTKPVSQAFFAALNAVPELTRSAVAKAAQAMIRDELKARREKIKASAVKEKARKPLAAKRPTKQAVAKVEQAVPVVAQPKRRSRKQAEIPAAG